MRWLVRAVAAIIGLAGCNAGSTSSGGSQDPPRCVPQEARTCPCVGGVQGVQTCNAAGDGFSECTGCTAVTSSSAAGSSGPLPGSSGAATSTAGSAVSGASSSGTGATSSSIMETQVTQMVGADGARVAFMGGYLDVPAGALTSNQAITVTRTALSAPAGYQAYSPVYRFEPDALTFLRPVTVSIPFTGDGALAALFWSRSNATGYERVGGLPANGAVTAEVLHFSQGFVANGVDYTDPPDLTCTRSRLLEGRTGNPVSSSVAVFFSVEDCQGRPVTGLTCDSYPAACDFVLKEDGVRLSSEAQARILPRSGLRVFASLVLDLSSSTAAALPDLIAGATAFVNRLQAPGAPPVPISIQLFAGEATLTEWQAPTLDTAQLLQRLDALTTFVPADPASTNLYGAVVQALARLSTTEQNFRTLNAGGALTAGYVVIFTDGNDTAGRVTQAAALAAEAADANQVLAVALQSPDFDATARAALEALAPNGVVVAPDAATLDREFQNLAARISGQATRTYLLGYCSPKRTGMHTVSMEVGMSTPAGSASSYTFAADGFQAGCAASSFDNLCSNRVCGGLACGACDGRVASCDGAACVSYCAQAGVCNGDMITNPEGYAQVCADIPRSAQCMGMCMDLRANFTNCGTCGNVCPNGSTCQNGECTCSNGLEICNGVCVDINNSATHCGACGNPCMAPTTVCRTGMCLCEFGNQCGNACVSLQTDANNCGLCGTQCAAPTSACSFGDCRCPNGAVLCGGTCMPASLTNCGSCGVSCQAGETCSGGCVKELASAQNYPNFLVANGGTLYWAGLGPTIQRMPISGGTPMDAFIPDATFAGHFTVDGNTVYWTASNGVIKKTDLGTGMSQTIATGQNTPRHLTVVGTSLVYGNVDGVLKVPTSGGTVLLLAPAYHPTALVVSGGNVYWADGSPQSISAIRSVPLAGGAVTTLATDLNGSVAMAAGVGTLYFVTQRAGTVESVSMAGGGPVLLTEGLIGPDATAVDATHVYWSQSGGIIKRMPLGGGAIETLATSQTSIQQVVLDGSNIYWTVPPNGTVVTRRK